MTDEVRQEDREDELFAEMLRADPATFAGLEIAAKLIDFRATLNGEKKDGGEQP